MNTFGTKLRVTTFGESHGPAIGGIIDGFPSGFKINFDLLQKAMNERRPGGSNLVSARNEADLPEFLSGINTEDITLGTPIGFIIRNSDNRGKDYSNLENSYRPNHADYTYEMKYGLRDFRGGGRASARETANWVVAGAIADQWLQEKFNITISAALSSVGSVSYTEEIVSNLTHSSLAANIPEIPMPVLESMNNEISNAKSNGDSVGGIVTCLIAGLPCGVGSPVFNKLHSRLAGAMMSINAAKGFEYGGGFRLANLNGSDVLDLYKIEDEVVRTETNYSGGILGGISNGMSVFFNVAFKPTPTLMKEIPTVSKDLQKTTLTMRGRHDPCVAVRAVPVVKALSALVIADFLL